MLKLERFNRIFLISLLISLLTLIVMAFIGCTDSNNQHEDDKFYTVNYSTSVGGTIVGITEQTVKSGDTTQSVEAVANDDYKFIRWSDGNTSPI